MWPGGDPVLAPYEDERSALGRSFETAPVGEGARGTDMVTLLDEHLGRAGISLQ